MFDVFNADIAQLEKLFAELSAKLENPFEICKMNIQIDASDFLDWTDKRLGRDQISFANRRAGFVAQIDKHFEQLSIAITQAVERALAQEKKTNGQS